MATQDPTGAWHLSEAEYESLIDDQKFLAALEAAGVDNWEGYETACQLHSGEITEDEL